MKNLFPFFKKNNLVYFDSAATSLKPLSVIERITEYYSYESVNTHRSSYPLALKISEEIENTRLSLKKYLNVSDEFEVIFTKNCTEAINIIALLFKPTHVLMSKEEHHSNYLPFIKNSLRQSFIPLQKGVLNLKSIPELDYTFCTSTWISNTLGKINDIQNLGLYCKKRNIPFLVDASQVFSHRKIDLSLYHFDFLTFSAHKLYGPTGLGILIARKSLLKDPLFLGGGTIKSIDETFVLEDLPYSFEAGTLPIASILGFKKSIEFLSSLNFEEEQKKEDFLIKNIISLFEHYSLGSPLEYPDIGLCSFQTSIHPMDLSFFLGNNGICARSGKLCTEPLLKEYSLNSVLRISLGCYNDENDLNILEEVLKKGKKYFEHFRDT
jgi:cysteine desulfurase/selenocysteine lyase